mmetsp:Transcript_6348/g.13287  ORF Transcript_6348/g.13287 Transcript_6348/m.13287 type:complete len:179 (-) Transcript_6348:125-661(-)
MSALLLMLAQFFVTAAGCVLSRRICKTATVAATLAGEISQEMANHYVRLCTGVPVIVTALSTSLIGSIALSSQLLLWFSLIYPISVSLQWTYYFRAIGKSYRQQAPQLSALLSLMLWSWAVSSGSAASCSAPRVLASKGSRILRLPRGCAILTVLAVFMSMVSALLLCRRGKKQKVGE